MYLSVASMLPQPLVSANGFIGVISADEEWYIFACHIQMSPVSSTYFLRTSLDENGIYEICNQPRRWRDCADAQAR